MSLINSNKLFLEADQLISSGRISEALEILHDIINDDPDYSKAHNHLGWIYDSHLYEYKLAEEHYKYAISFSPDYPSPYFNYYELLFWQKRYDDAGKLLDKAEKQTTVSKERVHLLRGRIKEALGEYEEAKMHYALYGRGSFDRKNIENAEEAIGRCDKKRNTFDLIIENKE